MSTIFTKIINREIPADIFYEDDLILAFLDIRPVNKGHALIIPKEPSVDGLETPPEIMARMINVAQKIGKAQKKTLGCDGVNFLMNNGDSAGQDVFHAHLHVIPRFKDDKRVPVPSHDKYESGESSNIAKKLAESL